jgi:hypothetical protein
MSADQLQESQLKRGQRKAWPIRVFAREVEHRR